MKNKKQQKDEDGNANRQGTDKAPGKEQEKKDNVTWIDLKGKKVDADPEKETDQPVEQKQDDK